MLGELREVAETTPPLDAQLAAPTKLGRGTAIRVEAPGLRALRAELARRFAPWLGAQDARGGFSPHVTVQNKVEPAAARALFDELSATWSPRPAQVEGLDLWWYRGGPWEAAGAATFCRR